MKFLKYRSLGNVYFQTGDGTGYVAATNNNIALVEVKDEHVPEMLLRMCGCCGNRFVCFTLASDEEIERWKS